MKSRLMRSHYTQNDVTLCVRNVHSVLCKYWSNVNYLTFNDTESLKYMCETMDIHVQRYANFIQWQFVNRKKWFINNADPIFVCKTPEEYAKSKTLPRISKWILILISSVIMP
jgi:hypothetical protein